MQENNLQNKKRRKKHRRSENTTLIGSIILCLVTLSAITLCMIMVFKYRSIQLENTAVLNELDTIRLEREATYTQGEVEALITNAVDEAVTENTEETKQELLSSIKEKMLSGDGTVAMLQSFFTNDIVLADGGQFYFIPRSDTLQHHTYEPSQFVMDANQFMNYYQDGELVSHKGIDVSRYQGRIDWKKVAEDGVEYAFIRAGIRGYTEGEILEDETFEDNMKGASKNHISTGVYFFSQATSVEEAEEEAAFVLEKIEPYSVTYPVVIDIEAVSSKNARTAELTAEERTQYCIAFCEKVKEAGYTPMIYGNLKTFMLMLDLEQLEEYDKWFADYDDEIYYPYQFKIWQYTDSGMIEGIEGEVDMNISFEDLSNE